MTTFESLFSLAFRRERMKPRISIAAANAPMMISGIAGFPLIFCRTSEMSHAHPERGRSFERGCHERKRTDGERWLWRLVGPFTTSNGGDALHFFERETASSFRTSAVHKTVRSSQRTRSQTLADFLSSPRASRLSQTGFQRLPLPQRERDTATSSCFAQRQR